MQVLFDPYQNLQKLFETIQTLTLQKRFHPKQAQQMLNLSRQYVSTVRKPLRRKVLAAI